jgi:hypothetical protein
MQIHVLIEPIARNGYRAQATEPFAVRASGATREEALRKLRAKIDSRLKKGAEIVGLEVGAKSELGTVSKWGQAPAHPSTNTRTLKARAGARPHFETLRQLPNSSPGP